MIGPSMSPIPIGTSIHARGAPTRRSFLFVRMTVGRSTFAAIALVEDGRTSVDGSIAGEDASSGGVHASKNAKQAMDLIARS